MELARPKLRHCGDDASLSSMFALENLQRQVIKGFYRCCCEGRRNFLSKLALELLSSHPLLFSSVGPYSGSCGAYKQAIGALVHVVLLMWSPMDDFP